MGYLPGRSAIASHSRSIWLISVEKGAARDIHQQYAQVAAEARGTEAATTSL